MMKFLSVALTIVALISHGYADITATANLHFDSSTSPVGTILFNQREPQGPVRIVGILDGLQNATVHGLHVHRDPLMNGELNCTAAGPHYNPYNAPHGPRQADLMHRHVGDLGNVTATEGGIIIIQIADMIIDFYNATRSVANRTIVLHAMRDDGGQGGFPDSNSTGDAGARIACGVISLPMEIRPVKNHRQSSMIHKFFDKLFP